MARYKLKTDHYRDGRYYRAGEYITINPGDVKPPRASIRVKDAEPEEEEISEEIPDTATPADAAKGKGARANDKSPV